MSEEQGSVSTVGPCSAAVRLDLLTVMGLAFILLRYNYILKACLQIHSIFNL